jgi:ABC-type antimicrobial peptide transport system permease subunit
MVLAQGLGLTAVGLVIGLGVAVVLGHFTASLLYGISGSDWITFITVCAVLLATAFVSSVLPARRAARVEPTTALRYE